MENHWIAMMSGNLRATGSPGNARVDAARRRLRECKDQREACEAIREIVSNLVGCEEMALFQLHQKDAQFELLWSFGVDPHDLHVPEVITSSVLPGLLVGETYIAESSNSAKGAAPRAKVSAILPIQLQGETVAVLVLLRLLVQKAKIDEQDTRLFAVIAKEAGNPLFGLGSTDSSERGAKQ